MPPHYFTPNPHILILNTGVILNPHKGITPNSLIEDVLMSNYIYVYKTSMILCITGMVVLSVRIFVYHIAE